MTRLIRHEVKMPLEVKVGNESKWICNGKLYKYEEGERVEIKDFN